MLIYYVNLDNLLFYIPFDELRNFHENDHETFFGGLTVISILLRLIRCAVVSFSRNYTCVRTNYYKEKEIQKLF